MRQINISTDFDGFTEYMRKLSPLPKVSIKDRPTGIPMPKLMEFISKTNVKDDWVYLERYMTIDGKKLEESFDEIKDKNVCSGMHRYRIGLIIERTKDKLMFTSYTLYDSDCVLNHKSRHTLDGNLLGGDVNTFVRISNFDDDLEDGAAYLDGLLDELLEKVKKFSWDVIIR